MASSMPAASAVAAARSAREVRSPAPPARRRAGGGGAVAPPLRGPAAEGAGGAARDVRPAARWGRHGRGGCEDGMRCGRFGGAGMVTVEGALWVGYVEGIIVTVIRTLDPASMYGLIEYGSDDNCQSGGCGSG